MVRAGARGDPYMDSPIDPAEALIVVTGIEPFLRHTSRDLGGAIVRAEKLPETLEAKIYRFINREEREPPTDLPAFDFDETVALIDSKKTGPDGTPPVHDDIDKTLSAFGGQHQMALEVGSHVTRIHAYLDQQVPRRVHIGLDGPHKLPPAQSELYRFRRCWRIASEPLALFDELQEYALSRDQVKCFAEMFPTTFKTLWPTVQRSLVRKRVASEKWELPRQKEILLRVLCQQEAPSLQLAEALAPVYAAEQQAQAARDQQRRVKSMSASNEGTPTQRLDQAS